MDNFELNTISKRWYNAGRVGFVRTCSGAGLLPAGFQITATPRLPNAPVRDTNSAATGGLCGVVFSSILF